MLTNEQLTPILKHLSDESISRPEFKFFAYYIGGSLCIDHDSICSICEINGGIIHSFDTETVKLTQENYELLFEVYKQTKGETDYYKECLEKFKISML